MFTQMHPRLLQLSDGRNVILDNDTDASTLQWILKHDILLKTGQDYEFLRRIVRARFNLKLEQFQERQDFPETDLPLFNAKEFINALPDEAFDYQLWAHPVIYVIHDWVDSGLVLKHLIPDIWCRSDFEAAIQILHKQREKYYPQADAWIATNFNMTREAFTELFIRSRVMHCANTYSRIGSNPGMIRRYRKDIASLVDRGNNWAHNARANLPKLVRNMGETLRDINRVNRAIDRIAETVNSPELKSLVEEGERIVQEWQTLRATQALRTQTKTKKK